MTYRNLTPEKLEEVKRRRYESRLKSYQKHLNKLKATNPYFTTRKNLNLVRIGNRIGSKTNALRWNAGETKEHVLKKLEICMELKEWGHPLKDYHDFITEAILVYEILCSETEKELENKIKKYPEELKVVKVFCANRKPLTNPA